MENLPLSSNFERYCDNHIFKFPVIVDTKFADISRIHPYAQAYIVKILDNKNLSSMIKQLIIFGSSINPKCRQNSDIDVYIVTKDDSNYYVRRKVINELYSIAPPLHEYKFNIYFERDYCIEGAMYENIKRGVVVINGTK